MGDRIQVAAFRRVVAHLVLVGMGVGAWAAPLRADTTLRTDHPIYAGEGAFQTVEDCVEFATSQDGNAQDRAIELYLWLLQHQFHLASPQEWSVPGLVPDSKQSSRYDMLVEDSNRGRFSFGYGLCGTVHMWNGPYWQAAGMRSRRRSFPGHTNSEVQYDGAWHAFDTDMAGLVFRRDGVVAGYADIARDPGLVKEPTGDSPHGAPCYPFAWPSDFRTMQAGWQQIAKAGVDKWYKMYSSGYAAHPGIVRLRAGETFTRYFDRDHFGGPSKRRFWHNHPGGPFRDWTFVNKAAVTQENPRPNALGRASYCNAEFVYEPKLADHQAGEGDALTFDHYSPYVIAGDPADDANPMSAPATGGLVFSGETTGPMRLELSNDQGQTWQPLDPVRGTFTVDATEQVKGRYGWHVRFRPQGNARLSKVRFVTVCQVNQAMYPRLSPNGSQVTYRARPRAVVAVEPNWSLSEEAIAWEVRPLRSDNLVYTPRGPKQRLAFKTTNNKPGTVVMKIESPDGQPLEKVNAAARFSVRVPPPAGRDFHLDLSTDGGKTWRRLADADLPEDNEYSSGWVYGSAEIDEADVTTALVRVHFYNGGYTTGLIDARAYGIYRDNPPPATTITYAWREGDTLKTHRAVQPAGAREASFQVPTGKEITDAFVRIAAE